MLPLETKAKAKVLDKGVAHARLSLRNEKEKGPKGERYFAFELADHQQVPPVDPDPAVDLSVVLRRPPIGPVDDARRLLVLDDVRKTHPTSLELVSSSSSNKLDKLDLDVNDQPTLVIQSPKSPKTPTLSRKLKAISLDSEPCKSKASLDVVRDVFSMPNTPKKHTTHGGYGRDVFDVEDASTSMRCTLGLGQPTNLKRFASNTSISGSQTLKTLPEIMMLQDFTSENRVEPVRIKAKGLLERRGSNASLTIDLGAATTEKTAEVKPQTVQRPNARLNSAKSISTLNLTTFGTCFTSFYQNVYKCEHCVKRTCQFPSDKPTAGGNPPKAKYVEHKEETCGNCTIYESVPSKFGQHDGPKDVRHRDVKKKCHCSCNIMMCGRKSLSNENLYVPPYSSVCSNGNDPDGNKNGASGGVSGSCGMHCRGYRRTCYPRQADLEASQILSDDFKMHLQNVQYLQTAGSVLSMADLKACCELQRVPKLHQEFWEVPLNLQEKCIVSGSQTRNRYRGVLPNEHSRVHLDQPQSYIHANFIKGPDYTESTYIATQGPMTHTCDDFWQMVWQTNCDCIVMLTQLVEKRRNKCELYFPLGTTVPSCTSSSSSSSKTHKTTHQQGQLTTRKVTYYTIKSTIMQQQQLQQQQHQEKFTFGHTHTCSSKTKATNNNNNCTSNNQRAFISNVKPFEFDDDIIEYEELDEVQHGNFRISFLNAQTVGDYTIRTLKLMNVDTADCRTVRHYWYPNWQDHKMAEPEHVLRLALNVLQYFESRKIQRDIVNKKRTHFVVDPLGVCANVEEPVASSVPLIVHCSAGIGRTGCFLAILNGIQQLRTNANVDVLAILCSLRLHRGGMVQTAEQYELIHRVLGMYADQMSQHQSATTNK